MVEFTEEQKREFRDRMKKEYEVYKDKFRYTKKELKFGGLENINQQINQPPESEE